MNTTRELEVGAKHQLRIARATLNMPDAIAAVMGGMTKEDARRIVLCLTGKPAKEAAQ